MSFLETAIYISVFVADSNNDASPEGIVRFGPDDDRRLFWPAAAADSAREIERRTYKELGEADAVNHCLPRV